MASGTTIISVLLAIATILNSYFLIIYSRYYEWKKRRDSLVEELFNYAKNHLNSQITLKNIKEWALYTKIFTYIFISLSFSFYSFILKISNILNAYNAPMVIPNIIWYFSTAVFIFFLASFIVGIIQKNSNFTEKIKSFRLYVFIKSLYPTTSDWLFTFISYLFLNLLIYYISPKLSNDHYYSFYLPQLILTTIAYYFGIIILIEILIVSTLRAVTENIGTFEDFEFIIYKDARDHNIVRVWTDNTVYEGKIKEIGKYLVISLASSHEEIPLQWDSIRKLEVIKSK